MSVCVPSDRRSIASHVVVYQYRCLWCCVLWLLGSWALAGTGGLRTVLRSGFSLAQSGLCVCVSGELTLTDRLRRSCSSNSEHQLGQASSRERILSSETASWPRHFRWKVNSKSCPTASLSSILHSMSYRPSLRPCTRFSPLQQKPYQRQDWATSATAFTGQGGQLNLDIPVT